MRCIAPVVFCLVCMGCGPEAPSQQPVSESSQVDLAPLLGETASEEGTGSISSDPEAERTQADSVVAQFARGAGHDAELRRALAECASTSPWHDQVLQQVLSLPIQVGTLVRLSPGIVRAYTDCGDVRVREWLRAGLRSDLAPEAYRHLVAFALETPVLDEELLRIAADRMRLPRLRALALESYGLKRVGFEDLPEFLASSYRADRLSDPFVERWVPLLLGASQTRDRTAIALASALAEGPPRSGGLALLRIVGPDTGAYSFLFSSEARSAVAEAVEQVSAQGPVWWDAAPAVREAREANRNRVGQVVRQMPMEWELLTRGDECYPVWPNHIAPVVTSALPDLTVRTYGEGCTNPEAIVADFDGEGSDDVLLIGMSDGRARFILVLSGVEPRVQDLGSAEHFDSIQRIEAGYHRLDGCFDYPYDEGRLYFPHVGFAISHDDKYSTYHHFENGELVENMGSQC